MNGEILESCECPLCAHNPVYKEDPKDGAPNQYYCHACNRGFVKPNCIGTAEYNRRHGKL